MGTAGAVDLPLDIWGGLVTDMPMANLLEGVSPDCADVRFTLTGVGTRPGLSSLYTAVAGNPTVNYVKSYIDPSQNQRTLFLDSLGEMWQEFPQGTVSLIAGGLAQNAYARSTTVFGREYIAIGDGKFGTDIPRQFDGTNFDRVSQVGPGAGPVVQDYLPAGANLNGSSGVSTATIAAAPTGAVRSGSTTVWSQRLHKYITVSTTVTITTTAAHGFSAGQTVQISGVTDATFDGTFTIATVPTSTTFTYAQQGTLNATSGSGTAAVAAALGLVRAGNVVTATTSVAHGFQVGWTVSISGATNVTLGGSITAIQRTASVVKVTTASAHYLVPGSVVAISGVTGDTTFNGTFTVTTVPNANQFTYAQTLNDSTGTGGASALVQDVFNGVFIIASAPTPTTFTYENVGPNDYSGNGTAAIQGSVSAGQHQVAVAFVTRQGYVTQPSSPVTFSAGGNKLVSLMNIPTGPGNVTGRIVMFTPLLPANALPTTGSFFYIPATMVINDNTTTSLAVDFSDAALQAGTGAATLWSKIELGECAGAIDYAGRTFWWGERNKLTNWLNLTFDGGWSGSTPLGWTLDPTFGAGGSRESTLVVWGDAYRVTGDGAIATKGKITQGAFQDYNNVALIQPNLSYSVRARVRSGGGLAQGTLHINLQSAAGAFTTPGLSVTVLQATSNYQEFIAELVPKTQIIGATPSDLLLQLYVDGTPTNGGFFIVDNVEIYPTLVPTNQSVLRASRAFDPETFDGVTGLLEISPQDGERIIACFKLREFLYVVKERSMYVTQDDPSSEPSSWAVKEVSNRVGAAGVNAIASEADSAIIVNRDGAYLFWGSEPGKISQEISPQTSNPAPVFSWKSINWSQEQTIWAVLDMQEKRALIGVPYGSATSPNKVLYFDFRTNDRMEELVTAPPIHASSLTGKLFAIAKGRKWAPWRIAANSGALVERSDGTAHTLLGNGVGNGKVYDLLDSQLSDDGAAINSYYLSYFVPSVMLEQQMQLTNRMKLFTYLTAYVEGSGTLKMTAYGPGQVRSYALPSLTLSSPPGLDQGYLIEIGEERVAFKFETNAAGSWFRMSRLIPSVKAHPTMPVRGI